MRLGLFLPTPSTDYDRVQSAIWIRALQMVDPLRKQGWDVSINNPFRRYDVAIYHRGMRMGSVFVVRFLKGIAKRVYWDTCVDYFDQHEAASNIQVICAREIAGMVDGICVPTEGIAQSARRYCSNVFVIPDCVDLNHFNSRKEDINLTRPIFGWSGVACKAGFLNPYADFLDNQMVIISEQPPLLSFRYRFIRWRYNNFPSALSEADIAFLPRSLESTYTANNSSFKALVYAVLGIPIIANRLPSYELMAEDFGAVAFLEDFNNKPQAAFEALVVKDRDPFRVRQAYDQRLWASRLVDWLSINH